MCDKELYESEKDNSFFINAQYNGENLNISGCPKDSFCPYQTFKNLLSSYIIPNYQQACNQ